MTLSPQELFDRSSHVRRALRGAAADRALFEADCGFATIECLQALGYIRPTKLWGGSYLATEEGKRASAETMGEWSDRPPKRKE